jgi:hypothetical protein
MNTEGNVFWNFAVGWGYEVTQRNVTGSEENGLGEAMSHFQISGKRISQHLSNFFLEIDRG